MVYGCTNSFIKFVLFVVNFLIFILGSTIFGLSLWACMDKNFTTELHELTAKIGISVREELMKNLAQYQASLWIFVAIGALLMVVGFLGCCGAGCESNVLVFLFFVIVFILALLQVFGLFFMYNGRDQLDHTLYDALRASASDAGSRKQLKPLEDLFGCCGATSETAYLYKNDGLCKDTSEPDCFTVMQDVISRTARQIFIAGIALLIIEGIALIFSCILMRAFNQTGYDYFYSA